MSDEHRLSTGELARTERVAAVLKRVRTDPRNHVLALIVCVVVGLTLSWFHWFGLVVGGALVGVVSKSFLRALFAAVVFGLVVMVAFALTLGEATWTVLDMWPAVAVTVGGTLGLPILGSLVRGIV